MEQFMADFLSGFVFRCVSQNSLPLLRQRLLRLGFQLYELNGSEIHDKWSLFDVMRRDVPAVIHGPLVKPIWDGLADDLWEGLSNQPSDRVAILWLAADRMLETNLPLLVQTIECVCGIAEELARPVEGGHAVLLRVFLLGEGPNFPDLANLPEVGGAV